MAFWFHFMDISIQEYSNVASNKFMFVGYSCRKFSDIFEIFHKYTVEFRYGKPTEYLEESAKCSWNQFCAKIDSNFLRLLVNSTKTY